MIDKVKKAVAVIKEAGLYVVAPVVFFAGILYYLITQRTSLQTQVKRLENEGEIKDAKQDANDAETEAAAAYSDYVRARDAALSGSDKEPR